MLASTWDLGCRLKEGSPCIRVLVCLLVIASANACVLLKQVPKARNYLKSVLSLRVLSPSRHCCHSHILHGADMVAPVYEWRNARVSSIVNHVRYSYAPPARQISKMKLNPDFASDFERGWLMLADLYIQVNTCTGERRRMGLLVPFVLCMRTRRACFFVSRHLHLTVGYVIDCSRASMTTRRSCANDVSPIINHQQRYNSHSLSFFCQRE